MDHPGLIKLHEVMNSPGHIFLVLDLAAGGELFSRLEEGGALSEPIARSYFQQLIDALDYMHSMNAIHRDLKPENLLLDSSDRLKIADFGLSVFSGGGMLKTRCGTPNYVAPEVLHANGYAGPPADIWSAGVILYVMLAAQLAFDAPNLTELARKIMSVQITYPRSMPVGAVDLIRSILIANPEHRPTIEQIRQHPWFAVNYVQVVGGSTTSTVIQTNVGEAAKTIATQPTGDDDGIDAFELLAALSNVNMDRLVNQGAPVSVATTFSCGNRKEDAVKNVIEVLESAGVRKEELAPLRTGKSVKVDIPCGSGMITVKINIRSITEQSSLIEIRRFKGQQFDFMRIYRTIKQRFGV
jgi:serine/threonine protein kinase